MATDIAFFFGSVGLFVVANGAVLNELRGWGRNNGVYFIILYR